MTSVVKQVRIEQPDESQGSNGRAVREMPHPENGQQRDQNRLCAGGCDNRLFHD